jgi:hypothetical protein
MIALLRFIATNAWLVSLVCLLGAIRYLWKAFTIRRAGAITPYTLERESAVGQVGRAWMTAAILAVVSLAVLIASPLILKSTSDLADQALPTPVAGIFTPTPGPTATPAPMPTALPVTPTLQASATAQEATVLPADTPTPEATATAAPLPSNCPDPRVQLSAPTAGQLVSGVMDIQGTADIPDFDYYKFEISGPITGGEWRTIGDVVRTPVSNGVLGYWDATPVVRDAPGIYLFRLVVVDRTGNYPPPCTVQVRIAAE